MTELNEALAAMAELQPKTTQGRVKIKYDGISFGDYQDYAIKLASEDRELTARFAHNGEPSEINLGEWGRKKQERGEICNFKGSLSHHETDRSNRDYPGKVTTTRSWKTENKTAHDDAKMFVLLWNNRTELMRLASIGMKAEQAVKA